MNAKMYNSSSSVQRTNTSRWLSCPRTFDSVCMHISSFGFDDDVAQSAIGAALQKVQQLRRAVALLDRYLRVRLHSAGCERYARTQDVFECVCVSFDVKFVCTPFWCGSRGRERFYLLCVCVLYLFACWCVDRELPIRLFVNSVFVQVGRVRWFGHCSSSFLWFSTRSVDMRMRMSVGKKTRTPHESHLFVCVCVCLCSGIKIRDWSEGFQLITAVQDGLSSCQKYAFRWILLQENLKSDNWQKSTFVVSLSFFFYWFSIW